MPVLKITGKIEQVFQNNESINSNGSVLFSNNLSKALFSQSSKDGLFKILVCLIFFLNSDLLLNEDGSTDMDQNLDIQQPTSSNNLTSTTNNYVAPTYETFYKYNF